MAGFHPGHVAGILPEEVADVLTNTINTYLFSARYVVMAATVNL
jgi:hypothetical protein